MDRRIYSVYAVRCSKTGRIYVGCTFDIDARIKAHFRELARGLKVQRTNGTNERERSQWQIDYDLYGAESFEYYILETDIPHERRIERESYWISAYKATDPARGYNRYSQAMASNVIAYKDGTPPIPHADE